MDLKQAKKVMNILAGIYLFFGIWLVVAPSLLCLIPLILLTVAIIAVNTRYWRCPHCGTHLGRDVSRYCTHCGEELEL